VFELPVAGNVTVVIERSIDVGKTTGVVTGRTIVVGNAGVDEVVLVAAWAHSHAMTLSKPMYARPVVTPTPEIRTR